MRTTLLLLFLLLIGIHANSQTDGISYQAVIIDEQAQEIPGIDITGNYLSNEEVSLRFTIVNEASGTEYQEVHHTMTDRYGLIEIIIGQGEISPASPGVFEEIEWDGFAKDLIVELSYQGEEFEEFSEQPLLFVPYAYHRNITAAGTLTVDLQTTLYDSLTVQDHGNVLLTGNLTVLDTADFKGTTLFQDIYVQGSLTVDSISRFNDQVTIDVSLPNDDENYGNYPLRVQGSSHGIAIKTNAALPDGSKNFITFFDSNEQAVGRIEGQTEDEMTSSAEYIVNTAILSANVASAVAGVTGATTSSTVCAGAGACVTAPIPSLNVSSGINLAAQIANLAAYQTFALSNLGVTYESGSADYAEWLQREKKEESFTFGDIVAMHGGQISRSLPQTERYMVISHRPAVLGNMPPTDEQDDYEMVAFMGQVPVKVHGEVAIGDYIIPSGLNDGFGRAVKAELLQLNDYPKIVGTAWSTHPAGSSGYVNVAIGMNQNDLIHEIRRQDKQLASMQAQIDDLRALIIGEQRPDVNEGQELIESKPAEELHTTIRKEELDLAMDQVRALLIQQGIAVDDDPFYGPLFNDSAERDKILYQAQTLLQIQREKAIAVDRNHGY